MARYEHGRRCADIYLLSAGPPPGPARIRGDRRETCKWALLAPLAEVPIDRQDSTNRDWPNRFTRSGRPCHLPDGVERTVAARRDRPWSLRMRSAGQKPPFVQENIFQFFPERRAATVVKSCRRCR